VAWQFDRPEQGAGMVQAFRRDKNEEASKAFRLCGLDPAVPYAVTNLDTNASTEISGKDLMKRASRGDQGQTRLGADHLQDEKVIGYETLVSGS